MGYFQEGSVSLCIGTIGMLGNIIAIPYFGSQIIRQKTFYVLLKLLSICDLIVVINGMLLYGVPKVSDSYASETYFIIAPYLFPTFEMGSTGSIYYTMAICIERYLLFVDLFGIVPNQSQLEPTPFQYFVSQFFTTFQDFLK